MSFFHCKTPEFFQASCVLIFQCNMQEFAKSITALYIRVFPEVVQQFVNAV